MIGRSIERMTRFYIGNHHDISHFLKVWALAKAIGEKKALERLR